ncbi:hypothetical protein J6590_044609 [Homalodisca vitripennis]|nr:hypothetical protein J6590_044609 [Homalodisca vitripennis]
MLSKTKVKDGKACGIGLGKGIFLPSTSCPKDPVQATRLYHKEIGYPFGIRKLVEHGHPFGIRYSVTAKTLLDFVSMQTYSLS